MTSFESQFSTICNHLVVASVLSNTMGYMVVTSVNQAHITRTFVQATTTRWFIQSTRFYRPCSVDMLRQQDSTGQPSCAALSCNHLYTSFTKTSKLLLLDGDLLHGNDCSPEHHRSQEVMRRHPSIGVMPSSANGGAMSKHAYAPSTCCIMTGR